MALWATRMCRENGCGEQCQHQYGSQRREVGARKLLGGLVFFVPRLQRIWADAAYRGKQLADWCQQHGPWELEVVEREPGSRGFSVQPRRWVVERSFAWLIRNRRLAKDYERRVQTSETLIEVAMIRLLVARQGRRN
jgi:putative transposase